MIWFGVNFCVHLLVFFIYHDPETVQEVGDTPGGHCGKGLQGVRQIRAGDQQVHPPARDHAHRGPQKGHPAGLHHRLRSGHRRAPRGQAQILRNLHTSPVKLRRHSTHIDFFFQCQSVLETVDEHLLEVFAEEGPNENTLKEELCITRTNLCPWPHHGPHLPKEEL